MHRHLRPASILALLFLLTSCTPAVPVEIPPVASATAAPPLQPTALPHAPEIRFALVGTLNGGNVWAMFDAQGYSYNDYAVRSGYWPRLYHITIPDGRFEPQAAAGASAVQPYGSLFAATVPLRTDLKWSDGTPFSAEDVAFTVNTALTFQLGFDWLSFYDLATLDHAEALDAHTVRFVFKRAPDVAHWQYGALQGPVVQKAYWQDKVTKAAALLPPDAARAQIEALAAREAELQSGVSALIASAATAPPDQVRQLQIELQRQQGNLDAARNEVAKAQAGVEDAMQAARQALYGLDATDEPMLSDWLAAGQSGDTWTNAANPAHPFDAPNFDRAIYTLYPDQSAALAAIEHGAADALLDPRGVAVDPGARPSSLFTVSTNATSRARFLVINPARPALGDPAFRRALFCALSRTALAQSLDAAPLATFVSPTDATWSNPEAVVGCNGYDPLTGPADISAAAAILKQTGYSWTTEPSAQQPGAGLMLPGGAAFQPIALLAPANDADSQSAEAARFVEQAARQLGIPLTVETVDPAEIRFALLNDHDYDIAIAGWRLSAYPGYLCDWFGGGNALGYRNPALLNDCMALASTSDITAARQLVFDIQAALVQDPAFIPLFSFKTYDLSRGLVYPFDQVLNGLSGVYGAPSLALPAGK